MEPQASITRGFIEIVFYYLALISLLVFYTKQHTQTHLSFPFPPHTIILLNSVFITSSEKLIGPEIYDLLDKAVLCT